MAHFAKIENDKVVEIIVISNDFESDAQNYIHDVLKLDGEWIQTSYNNNFRNKFAGIGDSYDRAKDIFIPKKPFDSWLLVDDREWVAPIAYPDTDKHHIWNESSKTWIPGDLP